MNTKQRLKKEDVLIERDNTSIVLCPTVLWHEDETEYRNNTWKLQKTNRHLYPTNIPQRQYLQSQSEEHEQEQHY